MNSNEDVIYINKGNKKYVNIIKKLDLVFQQNKYLLLI